MYSRQNLRNISTKLRLFRRSCESLIGICTGLLADNILNDEEIHFLHVWLEDNEQLSSIWPGNIVYSRVRKVLADGIITEDERSYLKKTLSSLIGGTLQESGAALGLSISLPLDKAIVIKIKNKSFCFTGQFLFGTRNACEDIVIKKKGIVFPRVRSDLDYLVIGSLINQEWAHTSYGRKIEKAVLYKKKGLPINIISEDQWVWSF